MDSKRIFIGSFIRSIKLDNSFDEIKKVFDKDNKISWTRTTDNFHITYFFLGQTPIDTIEEIQKFLSEKYISIQEIEVKVKGLNYFKRKGKPSILYAEIEENKELTEIFNQLGEFLLAKNIIEKKNPKFIPHITLGRIKKASQLFDNEIEVFKEPDFGQQNGIKIEIIESILHPEGALYKPLKL